MALVFAVWYKVEKTLSIHSIHTPKREAFYWLVILFTFALGTATGDLIAETFSVGYLLSAFLFGGLTALTYASYKYFNLNAVFAFWVAYILTRPLGASIGDYLSQDPKDSGLGLGTTTTSIIFLGAILVLVIFLTLTKALIHILRAALIVITAVFFNTALNSSDCSRELLGMLGDKNQGW